MSRIKKFTVIAVLFIVTGCSAVSYQPAGFRGGYSERQLAEQVYRVNYFGNGSVKLEQTIDFIMLRSAIALVPCLKSLACLNKLPKLSSMYTIPVLVLIALKPNTHSPSNKY